MRQLLHFPLILGLAMDDAVNFPGGAKSTFYILYRLLTMQ